MGRAIDLLHIAFKKVAKDGHHFLDYNFIMNIFQPLYEQSPDLRKYPVLGIILVRQIIPVRPLGENWKLAVDGPNFVTWYLGKYLGNHFGWLLKTCRIRWHIAL
jgi:hypothetical protein